MKIHVSIEADLPSWSPTQDLTVLKDEYKEALGEGAKHVKIKFITESEPGDKKSMDEARRKHPDWYKRAMASQRGTRKK